MLRTEGNRYDHLIAYVNLLYTLCLTKGLPMWAGMCPCRKAQAVGMPTFAETRETLTCMFCDQPIPDAVEILNGKERTAPDYMPSLQ
jgi:hypothetical protein